MCVYLCEHYMRANCEGRIITIKSWCIARRVLDEYIANCHALSNDQVHVIPS